MIIKLFSLLLKLWEGQRLLAAAKKKGILYYLKFLQTARISLLGVVISIFAFQFFFFSFIGLIASGVYLSPLEPETKVWLVFYFCLLTVVLFLIGFWYAFSEKTWLKHSGAKNLISKQ